MQWLEFRDDVPLVQLTFECFENEDSQLYG